MRHWIVELFGASAIGKTTLLREYLSASDEEWIERSHLNGSEFGVTDPLYERLFLSKGNWIIARTQVPIPSRVKSLESLSRAIKVDIAARGMRPKASILDEGIAHYLGNYLRQEEQKRPGSLSDFMKKRAFVHMTGTPEDILIRVRKRLETDPGNGVYGSFRDDESILKYLRRSIDDRIKVAELVASLGCPTVTLDIADTSDTNLDALNAFIGGLDQQDP